jgi:hypothetical protein
MTEPENFEFVKRQLQAVAPAWKGRLEKDLWPRMRRKLEDPPVRFGWFEAVLAGAIGVSVCLFPKLILPMLYHL